MDIGWLILLVVVAVALYLGFVRPSRRSKTPEEQLEQVALKAEQDQMKTEAQYRADRYNLRE